jgi:hypothetical protein
VAGGLWVVGGGPGGLSRCPTLGRKRPKRNHIHQLEALGYTVTLTPAA